jgi:peroxiredoxin
MNKYVFVFAVTVLTLIKPMMAQQFTKAEEAKGLTVGEIAPDFSATNQNDFIFNLYETLKQETVVLVFYRGHWCPYCNKHLKALQDSLVAIESKGAHMVAVTPENSDFINKTIDQTHASFTLLYDEGYRIAKAYGVNFLPDSMQRFIYNSVLNAQLKKSHSDDSEQLPIPATFIISKNKIIQWRHFDPDYKKRSNPADIINNL